MQRVMFFATHHQTGAVLPGASVRVKIAGTSTDADLFDAAEAPIGNPLTADTDGLVDFKAANGVYDISITFGSYTTPTIQEVNIFDGAHFQEEIDAAVAGEAAARAGADSALSDALTEQINLRATIAALSAEVDAREDADVTLQNDVDERATITELSDETAAREAADAALQSTKAPLSAGYAENIFLDALDPSIDSFTSSGNVVAETTNEYLLDRGITHGIERGSNSAATHAKLIFPEDTTLSQVLTGREYYGVEALIEAGDGGSYGFVIRQIYYNLAGTSIANITLTSYEQVDANVRRYYGFGQLTSSMAGAARAGVSIVTAPANGKLLGIKMAFREWEITGFGADDYPSAPDPAPVLDEVSVGNDFLSGNYPDEAEHTFSGNTVVDITDPTLVAMGFSRAVAQGGAESTIFYGDSLKRTLRGNEYYGALVVVQTDTPDNFGTSRRAWVYKGRGSQLAGSIIMTMESQIDEYLAIYSIYGQFTSTHAGGNMILVGATVGTASNLRVMGGQFAVSPRPIRRIMPGDYPLSGEGAYPILPDTLFMQEGEDYTLYCPNFLSKRDCQAVEEERVLVGFGSHNPDNLRSIARHGIYDLVIDPDCCGPTATIDIRPVNRDRKRRRRNVVAVQKAPASLSGITSSVMILGNSLFNRQMGSQTRARLEARGMSVSYIGSLQGQSAAGVTGAGEWGEAREGWRAAEYVNLQTTRAVLPVGQEDDYQNVWSHATRLLYNPMVRAEVGSEANARNGYIFDPDFYLNRWTVPKSEPEVLLIDLFTNDVTAGNEASVALVEESYRIILDQWRLTMPNTQIGIAVPPQPWSQSGDVRWVRANRDMYLMLNRLVREYRLGGDDRVWLVAAYAEITGEVGYEISGGSFDPDTGTKHSLITDTIHFPADSVGLHQFADSLTRFIACVAE